MARHGQAPDRFHQSSRPADHRCLSAGDRVHVHLDQPAGRRSLFGARPAGPLDGKHRLMATEQTPFQRIVADFVANPVAVFGLVLLAIVLLTAIVAPLISPQNPYDLAQLDVMDSRLPPGSPSPTGGTFWLGTDDQGRDMLSGIFYGFFVRPSRGGGAPG